MGHLAVVIVCCSCESRYRKLKCGIKTG